MSFTSILSKICFYAYEFGICWILIIWEYIRGCGTKLGK